MCSFAGVFMATTYDAGGANITPAICSQIPASWYGSYQEQGSVPRRFVRGNAANDTACGVGKYYIKEESMKGVFTMPNLVDPETMSASIPRSSASGLCDSFCVDPKETDADRKECKTLSCSVEAWQDSDKLPDGYGEFP